MNDASLKAIDTTKEQQIAVDSLKTSPYWPELIGLIRDRRESWIRDSRLPNVYHNHAELAATMAHTAELDDWLELLA
jgi:hypothetical protein